MLGYNKCTILKKRAKNSLHIIYLNLASTICHGLSPGCIKPIALLHIRQESIDEKEVEPNDSHNNEYKLQLKFLKNYIKLFIIF